MKCELISIGDELLIGQTINTNASWIGQQINQLGVDVIGISSHAAAHMTLVTDFMKLLESNNKDYIVVCGGVIPRKDITKLKDLGVSEIFGPGTNIIEASYKVLNLIKYGKKSNI